MNISADRQIFLVRLMFDYLYDQDLADFSDEDMAIRVARKALEDWVKEEEEIEQAVRNKIKTLKRHVIEGSPEYEILFKKYDEEERGRRGKN